MLSHTMVSVLNFVGGQQRLPGLTLRGIDRWGGRDQESLVDEVIIQLSPRGYELHQVD